MSGLVSLIGGGLRVDLAPAIGGSIASFRSEAAGRRTDWLRAMAPAALAAGDVGAAACFPLVPFSNRIRDCSFVFEGRTIRLRHACPDAEHGHGWLAPWRVESARSDRATLVFERAATDDWPFAYRAHQHVVLGPSGLEMRLEIANAGTRRMPAGFGLHPYFPRTPRTVLRANVCGIWETDDRILPTRLAAPDGPRDPRSGLIVDAVALDNCFTGWDGRAEIEWPERDAGLTMTAEGPLGVLVVYTPPGEDFFCAEPVSNATDAFNLAAGGRTDTGMLTLDPGQEASARVLLTPR